MSGGGSNCTWEARTVEDWQGRQDMRKVPDVGRCRLGPPRCVHRPLLPTGEEQEPVTVVMGQGMVSREQGRAGARPWRRPAVAWEGGRDGDEGERCPDSDTSQCGGEKWKGVGKPQA